MALSLDESWMKKLDSVYERRKKIAQVIMDEIGAEYEDDKAGLFVWAKLKDRNLRSESYCDEILYDSKVFITPGHIFGKNGEGYVRISLCSTEEVMNNALERIKATK